MKTLIQALSRKLDRAMLVAAVALLVVMLALVLWQVVTRYVFNAPPEWTEELARHCMVWAGLLGATCALRRRADPKLTEAIGTRTRAGRLTARIGRTCGILMFVTPTLLYGPGFVARHAHRVTETLGINSAYVVVVVPLAAAIIAIHALAQAVED
jgi:TRAP-type transport system small permease protein